jgi:FMN phosphatase YigB (HAD superfamily)
MTVEYLVDQSRRGRQVVFDLDNTIYLETHFLFSVYKAISLTATNVKPYVIYNFLKKTFMEDGRKNLFNKLERSFPLESFSVEKSLLIMRNYKCDCCIKTLPWFNKFLAKMDSEFIVKIITNGTPQQQLNKIKSINFSWPEELIEVVCASAYEAKPKTLSFYHLKGVEEFISPIYVGDSLTDKQFCKNLNIEFYNINGILA